MGTGIDMINVIGFIEKSNDWQVVIVGKSHRDESITLNDAQISLEGEYFTGVRDEPYRKKI